MTLSHGSELRKPLQDTTTGTSSRPRFLHELRRGSCQLKSRKVDLLILDMLLGSSPGSPEYSPVAGTSVFEAVQKTCFASTVFYTSNPSLITVTKSAFVRVVNKVDGTDDLVAVVTSLFDLACLSSTVRSLVMSTECFETSCGTSWRETGRTLSRLPASQNSAAFSSADWRRHSPTMAQML